MKPVDRLSSGAYKCLRLFDWFRRKFGGACRASVEWLAQRLECSKATVKRWTRELELAGAIAKQRRGRAASYYTVLWKDLRKSQGVLAFMAPVELLSKPSNEPTKQAPSITESIESSESTPSQTAAVENLLEEYPHAKHLEGRPGPRLAKKCLDLAGGDIDRFWQAIRAMWKAEQKPGYSWGWFLAVLPNYLAPMRRRA